MTLAILGTGGHARSIYDIIKNKKVIFFDRNKKKFRLKNKVFKVTGNQNSMMQHKHKISKVLVAIGNNNIRRRYFETLKKNKFKFSTLIHPKSYISFGSKVGEGSVVMQGSLINTDSFIGNNCIINTNASIDHDCVINDHTHICPGVVIAGNVNIGKNCWIGLGAKIIENCIIGDNVFIAAGSLVTKNLKSNTFVKGVPAKYARKKLAKF